MENNTQQQTYNKSAQAVMTELVTTVGGLDTGEAAARTAKYGKNIIERGKKKGIVMMYLDQLKNAMVLILIAAAIISGVFGEFADMAIILAVVILNATLGVVQESKAEKAVEALKKMSAPRVKVRRGGEEQIIPAEDLVPGDIIVIEAGDTLAADVRLIDSHSLKVDESMLTGESVPVEKHIDALAAVAAPLGDQRNMAFMGTNAVYGRGAAVVVETGMRTQMGKIATALSEQKATVTPLNKQLNSLGKVLSIAVIAICVLIFLLHIFSGAGLKNMDADSIFDAFLLAVSLAVAAIPEGLMAVVTLVMTMGIIRMSKKNAIIRKLPAVETLGCAEVICSDKTGTLTQNKMTVVSAYADGKICDEGKLKGKAFERTLYAMLLCNDSRTDSLGALIGDPTETALITYAEKCKLYKAAEEAAFPRSGEVPFDSRRKLMSTVHRLGGGYIQYVKGGVDEVLARCISVLLDGKVLTLTKELKDNILKANGEMSDRALRVLAYAYREHDKEPAIYDEKLESGLTFCGLTGMIDPVRPEVYDAVVKCYKAGIRPIMITGDHKNTAIAIAKELGIIKAGYTAITGAELDAMSDDEFDKKLSDISVYARVSPENKVRIVKAWRKRGKITAMTGDGVNDAPALKSSDIGVGMGITGTDVTKNVADIVLTDDNFNTIVVAVEEGRKIYVNIKKTVQFLLSTNMCEVLVLLIAALIEMTRAIPFLIPIHILWINLVTDTIPALGLGVERAENDVMSMMPRNPKKSLLSDGTGIGIIYQSMIMAGLVMAAYFIGERQSPEVAVTMAFGTLSLLQIAHSFNMKSRGNVIGKKLFDNKWLLYGAVLTTALTLFVIYIPFVNDVLFKLVPLDIAHLGIMLGLSLVIIPIVDAIKLVTRLIKKA